MLLLQRGEDLCTDTTRIEAEAEAAVALVQTVRGNYEGYTKGKVSEGSAQGAGDDGEPKREGLRV